MSEKSHIFATSNFATSNPIQHPIKLSFRMKAYTHEVKYYECDRMGITHHSNYIRFMEEARVDLMDQLGYGFDRMEAEGVVSPVVSVECQYKHPTTFRTVVPANLTSMVQ